MTRPRPVDRLEGTRLLAPAVSFGTDPLVRYQARASAIQGAGQTWQDARRRRCLASARLLRRRGLHPRCMSRGQNKPLQRAAIQGVPSTTRLGGAVSETPGFAASQELIRRVLLAARPPAGLGPVDDEPMEEFPLAGIDVVHHALRVRLDVGETGTADETVTLFGKMLIARRDPYVNESGRRQVDFEVRAWEASGWSWALKQALTYVLSEDIEQPLSSITAEQDDVDFPATFSFNVIFDVRADNRPVFRQQHGRPEGASFLVVPPNGNRAMSPRIRSFEDTRVRVEHPSLGVVQAVPVDCNDLGSMTLASF